jgi:hypothetical protein
LGTCRRHWLQTRSLDEALKAILPRPGTREAIVADVEASDNADARWGKSTPIKHWWNLATGLHYLGIPNREGSLEKLRRMVNFFYLDGYRRGPATIGPTSPCTLYLSMQL